MTRPELTAGQSQHYAAVLNSVLLAKCAAAQLWENSPFVSKQLRGIGPATSNLLATAGKVSFMLLEETHPRDLERVSVVTVISFYRSVFYFTYKD